MAAFTDYLEDRVLRHVFLQDSFTGPGAIYVALYKDDPGDDISATEHSGGGYERARIKFQLASGTTGSIINSEDVVFPVATENWVTVNYVALFDSKTGGNPLVHAKLGSPVDIAKDDSFLISSGNFTIVLD